MLARSLDYERTLAEVAQLAVPEFADWCAVDVVQADGSLRQITSLHGVALISFDWSPDGMQLAFSRGGQTRDVALIEDTGQK